MYVCMYVCMHACMDVCIYIYLFIYIIYIYIYLYLCIYQSICLIDLVIFKTYDIDMILYIYIYIYIHSPTQVTPPTPGVDPHLGFFIPIELVLNYLQILDVLM